MCMKSTNIDRYTPVFDVYIAPLFLLGLGCFHCALPGSQPNDGCDCAAQATEMITGEDFGLNPLPPVEAVRKWWEKNRPKFKLTRSRRDPGISGFI